MKYQREFSPHELLILGPEPQRVINELINRYLSRKKNINNADTAEARLLNLMSDAIETTPAALVKMHNLVHNYKPISPEYCRVILSRLYSQGLVNRSRFGHYTKVKNHA